MEQQSNKDTALLVFSLSAGQEAKRKPLFGRNQRRAGNDFFNLLIQETARLARAVDVDVFWIDEQQQRGGDFASRFTNAFEDLYAKGYKNVLSIGNDCPGLTIDRLQKAITLLKQKKTVVGPAEDGGVYLIGLSEDHFDPKTFKLLPWQKTHLYDEIILRAHLMESPVYSLDPLADIDCRNDVLTFVHRKPESALSLFIIKQLETVDQPMYADLPQVYIKISGATLPLRAPPSFQMIA